MPGVDFRALRQAVSMAEVLELIGFVPQERCGDTRRGPCPVHRARSSKSRSFAAHLRHHVYQCFGCGSAGNHLDLYAAVTRLGVYEAAVELCAKLQRDIPWVQRW